MPFNIINILQTEAPTWTPTSADEETHMRWIKPPTDPPTLHRRLGPIALANLIDLTKDFLHMAITSGVFLL